MKDKSPIDNKWYLFVDKAVPFGSSSSCQLYQRVSDCVAHLVRFKTGKPLVNYLDDYLFAALLAAVCNNQIQTFLDICATIRLPVALEKTFWASQLLVFLGLLINTVEQTVSIPVEKVERAVNLIREVLNKKSRKITLKQLQKLCGFLNFLGRCIIPGRAFTRRLYAHSAGSTKLLPHHHIRVTEEMKLDLTIWLKFLSHPSCFCRPFLDFTSRVTAHEIDMFSDASKNPELGFGATCQSSFLFHCWDRNFIIEKDPSIEYLELYAVLAGVMNWIHRFRNQRVVLFCDNQAVCYMINSDSSSCKHCMKLIRLLVLKSLLENVRVFAKYVSSKSNYFADLLSRLKMETFWRLSRGKYDLQPDPIPQELWPMNKVW